MKKIFILTGEPSGDKLASKVISKLQKNNPNIEYACVGGTHLNSLGIKSIFNLKEITHIGFTSVCFPWHCCAFWHHHAAMGLCRRIARIDPRGADAGRAWVGIIQLYLAA